MSMRNLYPKCTPSVSTAKQAMACNSVLQKHNEMNKAFQDLMARNHFYRIS